MALHIAGVVVLYYPTKEHFKNITNYLDEIDKLYVIDNTGNDFNKQFLPKSKKIEYTAFFNIGVASALNKSAEWALNSGYSWLLTMDQDTKISSSTLKQMKKKIEDIDTKKIGIVTPWHKTKLKAVKPKEKIDYPQDVMTSGNLLNLSIWKQVGGFRDDFFIDGIDIEYGLRLKKNGFKIMRLNYLEINHNLGDIFYVHNKLCTNYSGIRRYYMNRNYHYIYDLYHNTDEKFCKFLISNYKTMAKVLLFERNKFSKFYGYFLGYIHYKKGKKGKLTKFLFKKI